MTTTEYITQEPGVAPTAIGEFSGRPPYGQGSAVAMVKAGRSFDASGARCKSFEGKYDMAQQMISQGKAVCKTLPWSGIGSVILHKFIDLIIGLRPLPRSGTRGPRYLPTWRVRLRSVD